MNVYDYIQAFAEAIRDDVAVRDYCVAEFASGLLVQIDDDSENMVGSASAPYCLLHSVTGSDDSPVADASAINLRMEIGIDPTLNSPAPFYNDATVRSASANGLRKYGQGQKAVELLALCLATVRGVNIDSCNLMETSSVDANGSLLFPLQVAQSVITISERNDLSSF